MGRTNPALRVHLNWGRTSCARIRANGLTFNATGTTVYRIEDDDPLAAAVESTKGFEFTRDHWTTKVLARETVTADATHFHLTTTIEAFEDNSKIFERSWEHDIPRDHL
ncbi:hypothetical protein [Rhodococcus koreensis]|uniref:hypothetical protein n=1 Tax=Rhodococcus koreensis TaxID=99653 RepID=UPI00115FF1EF|nr:hypothetical protein [Rhodococcus koreensis]